MRIGLIHKILLSALCLVMSFLMPSPPLQASENMLAPQAFLKSLAAPVYIRIFKEESRLEVWQKSGNSYTLYKAYKICKWSGRLGPKQIEGDKQSPEGFYTLTSGQMGWYTRKWRQSFNIGFPNNYDLSQKRTGTNLLIHGGCSSVGCYAMTNKAMSEIYEFIASKAENGQQVIPLHIFPFRMTKANLERHKKSPWLSFWQELKPAYDMFEQTRTPPFVEVCSGKYHIRNDKPVTLSLKLLNAFNRYFKNSARLTPKTKQQQITQSRICKNLQARWVAKRAERHTQPKRGNSLFLPSIGEQAYGGKLLYPRIGSRTRQIIIRCNINRPSCKRWIYLKKKRLRKIYAKSRSRHRTRKRRSARRRIKHRNYRTTRKRGRRVARKRTKKRRR